MLLEHVPSEGIWHAEVCCKVNPQKKLTGPDRVDLIVYLKNVFSALEPHSCTD